MNGIGETLSRHAARSVKIEKDEGSVVEGGISIEHSQPTRFLLALINLLSITDSLYELTVTLIISKLIDRR